MKSRKRRSGRHNPPKHRHHRRHYRHNPPAFRVGAIVTFGKDAVIGAGEVLAGKIIARKSRGMLGQKPGTVLGSVIEATVGIIAGLGVSRLNAKAGAMVAIGGVLSPMETLVQQLGIPHVSDSLADDGFLFGGDSGVEMVSAVPDRGNGDNVREFVEGGGRANVTLGEFVAGAQQAA
jgi:hypothetical protein